MRQMQDTKQDKRNPALPTNLLSSFGWAYRVQVRNMEGGVEDFCLLGTRIMIAFEQDLQLFRSG